MGSIRGDLQPLFVMPPPPLDEDCDDIFNSDESSWGLLNLSCFGIIMGLWFFASVCLIFGVYGSETVSLGHNSSILIKPSSIFVKSIKAKELDFSKPGLQLYGINGQSTPSGYFVNWTESRVLSVSQNSYKGWPYYLNRGTHMNISYNILPKGSAVRLVITEVIGMPFFYRSSLKDIAFRDTAWSWNLIQGSGMIQLDISKSKGYYLTVANLKRKDVEVELDIDVKAVLYDTKQSSYNCSFSNGECSFKMNERYPVENYAVVTSPALGQGVSIDDEWYIELSYQPRLIAYGSFTCVLLSFMLVAIHFCNKLKCCGGEGFLSEDDSVRTCLLADKGDDDCCNDVEASNKSLCAICFDAPRDCCFLPCGHCVSCYQCGTKIKRTKGRCPICRKKMMHVKRIYTA
ncbi:hypothetical protein ISN44_As02g033260 [Arabidopsis suecica]|uniref:RING-type E3 ubiquitin transferase n=1 Tax=Arabidopsis suecica TaxID=45249 RepID=A0A8T2G7X4_ARASU|nr:hypothetical protein ISN44_As02g033260 [Arabidopsis suecica]